MYDIQNNLWSETPNLNVSRSSHGSCSLAKYVYVFAGNENMTVERLDASVEIFPETWTCIAVSCPPLRDPLVAVIRED